MMADVASANGTVLRQTALPVAKRRSLWAQLPPGAPMLDDPDQMTVQQRHDEITTILATGILRLRNRRHLAPDSLRQINADSDQNGLEVSRDMPLHGANGLTPARANEGSDE